MFTVTHSLQTWLNVSIFHFASWKKKNLNIKVKYWILKLNVRTDMMQAFTVELETIGLEHRADPPVIRREWCLQTSDLLAYGCCFPGGWQGIRMREISPLQWEEANKAKSMMIEWYYKMCHLSNQENSLWPQPIMLSYIIQYLEKCWHKFCWEGPIVNLTFKYM